MRAKDFLKEDDDAPIRIKIGGGGDTLAKKFVKHLYDTYPRSPINNREFYIAFSEDEFAMFDVQARAGAPDTAYVSWMSAYPQRQGVGTRALQQLQQEAADFGVNLELIAWDKGNVSKSALTRFYKKNGFKKGMGDMLKWQHPVTEDNEQYSVKCDNGQEFPCSNYDHAVNKARSLLSYKKCEQAFILKNGETIYKWSLGTQLEPVTEEYQLKTDPHVDILISGTWGYRVFYKATIKPEYRELVVRPVVAQATVNFQQHGRVCHLDYIISNADSEEYSSELLDEILESLRRHKVHKIVAVVEDPQVMHLFTQFGFKTVGTGKRGTEMDFLLV